jgi:hypothetical protein
MENGQTDTEITNTISNLVQVADFLRAEERAIRLLIDD